MDTTAAALIEEVSFPFRFPKDEIQRELMERAEEVLRHKQEKDNLLKRLGVGFGLWGTMRTRTPLFGRHLTQHTHFDILGAGEAAAGRRLED